MAPPPGGLRGRGVVICGGGLLYFTNAYVAIRMLRRSGCDLPVELWHLGPREVTPAMARVVEPFGVTCVDALGFAGGAPPGRLDGWALKAFAILHCSFRQLLSLDADNVAVRDPSYLFETPQFRETGAIFWPDHGRLYPEHPIWRICGIPPAEARQFESGQIVVDKERHWRPLQLALWYGLHGAFFWRYVNGDKEAFHLAFRKVGAPFAMPDHPVAPLEYTLCQHDFAGNRVFQHRNQDKWRYDGANALIEGFLLEPECFAALQDLRARWRPGFAAAGRGARLRRIAQGLARGRYRLRCAGFDERPVTFLPEGRIGEGFGDRLRYWDLEEEDGQAVLHLLGADHHACRLVREGRRWRGTGGRFEPLPYVLDRWGERRSAAGPRRRRRPDIARARQALMAARWIYRRQDLDAREMGFAPGGRVDVGPGWEESRWALREDGGDLRLELYGPGYRTCALAPRGKHGWRGRWDILGEPLVELTRVRGPRPRPALVFVAPLVPRPDGVGLARRIWTFLVAAAARHQVHLVVVPVSGGGLEVPPGVGERCARVAVIPPGTPTPATPEVLARCEDACAGVRWGAVHVARLYMVPLAWPFLRPRHLPVPLCTLDLDEVESAAHHRLAALWNRMGDPQAAAAHAAEAERCAGMEASLLPVFDRVFVCSEREREALAAGPRPERTRVVPNAVPVPARLPRRQSGRGPAEGSLLFVGNLSYPPNQEAARFLCEALVPRLRARLGAPVRLRLVGAGPPPWILALGEQEGVEVHGDVAAVEPFYRRAAVAVAPLWAGGGTRIKILEAFAQGVPVVSTRVGAEGLAVGPGEHLLLADDPDEFAEACARLLRDPALARRLARAAHALARRQYTLDGVARGIAQSLDAAWEEPLGREAEGGAGEGG